jgi:hypothetical protein
LNQSTPLEVPALFFPLVSKKKKKKQQQKKTTTTSFSRVIFIKFLGLYFTSLQALEPWQSSFHLLALPSASCVFSSL